MSELPDGAISLIGTPIHQLLDSDAQFEEALAKVDVPPGISLEHRCDGAPLQMRGDLGQIRSILVNLLACDPQLMGICV